MTYTREQFDQFIGSQKYPPNKFQQQVLEELAFGEGNIAVDALAGSGKTTLLTQCAALMRDIGVAGNDVMFLAFNTRIRDELNNRLPHGFNAINSHSYGNQALKKAIGKRTRREASKYYDLVEQHVIDPALPLGEFTKSDRYLAKRKIKSLVSKVMMANVDPDDTLAMQSVAIHHGLLDSDSDTLTEDVIIDLIQRIPNVIRASEVQVRNTGQVDFDDMLYFAVRLKAVDTKFKYILVDEAQDLNRAQQELVALSLAEGARVIIVGDEKQAIYGFAGADDISFKRMINRFDAKRLPLNICYRCPESVLDYARAIVPQIEPRPGAPAGSVKTHVDESELHKLLEPGDMIICRLNAPLLSTYFKLIGERKKAQIIGKDVTSQLTSVLEKMGKMSMFRDYHEHFTPTAREYQRQMTLKYSQDEYGDTKIALLGDTIECLITCFENFDNVHSMKQFEAELKKLFPTSPSDEAAREKQRDDFINLSSVHRAKGLEADRVVIISPEKMPLEFPKQQPWEYQQELNIAYVAMTRAKKEMIFCGEPPVQPVKMGEEAKPLPTVQPVLPEPKPASDITSLEKALDDIKWKHHADEILNDPSEPNPYDGVPAEAIIADLESMLDQAVVKIDRYLLKVADGRTDDGAEHRMVDLARALFAAGLWDGKKFLYFHNPYQIHNKVNGIDHMPITDLNVYTNAFGVQVKLPEPTLEPQPEGKVCPFCKGEGEDGEFVCDECDGSGEIFHEVSADEIRLPEKSPAEVSEHLRKLPAGMKPTERAFELAAEHGIDLNKHPGKTFVSPHSREPMEESEPQIKLTSPSFADDDHTIEAETPELSDDDLNALVSTPPAYLNEIAIASKIGAIQPETAEQADAVRDALLAMDTEALTVMRDLIDLILARQSASKTDDAA